MHRIVVLTCLFLSGIGNPHAAESLLPPKQISRVYLEAETNVRIVYSDGQEVAVPKEEGQISCEALAVADDKRTAGWLVDDQEVGSYAVPTTLVIYRDGQVLRKFGNGLMLRRWNFLDGGKAVAFSTDSVHGDARPAYELRDIESNRLIDQWQGSLNEKSPAWAIQLSRP